MHRSLLLVTIFTTFLNILQVENMSRKDHTSPILKDKCNLSNFTSAGAKNMAYSMCRTVFQAMGVHSWQYTLLDIIFYFSSHFWCKTHRRSMLLFFFFIEIEAWRPHIFPFLHIISPLWLWAPWHSSMSPYLDLSDINAHLLISSCYSRSWRQKSLSCPKPHQAP